MYVEHRITIERDELPAFLFQIYSEYGRDEFIRVIMDAEEMVGDYDVLKTLTEMFTQVLHEAGDEG